MSRHADVERLAPVAPPCFSSRGQWVEYLKSAAEHQRNGSSPGPLLIERGEPVRFNRHLNICQDCTQQHQLRMASEGKCQPVYLLRLLPIVPGHEPLRVRTPKGLPA